MADRPCDCVRPKSPLCSCQHCRWFCAGRDAVVIHQARTTWPKRHLLNAYELLLTRYDQFHTGVGHFRRIFQREEALPTNRFWYQKTRVIALLFGIRITAVHHLVLSQYMHLTDGWMDGQNCDSNTVRCITCSRTVKITEMRLNGITLMQCQWTITQA